MNIYDSVLIEQDAKNDQRFRITLPEGMVCVFREPDTTGMIHHFERRIQMLKRRLSNAACDVLKDLPARKWAQEHGGRSIWCRITFRPAGATHYRAGLSITFKERDKAMLFKMMFVGSVAEAEAA